MTPLKLSSNAIAFEFVNRPNYRMVVPGSKTRSSVSSFILFKNEESMLEELPNYGNSFIVDKYSNTFYELLDHLVQGGDFLSALTAYCGLDITPGEGYLALAVQLPYGLQAMPDDPQSRSDYTITPGEFSGKDVPIDSTKIYGKSFGFLYKCLTTKILKYTREEEEKIFFLDPLLESCPHQLMYLNKQCAVGCALCPKGSKI